MIGHASHELSPLAAPARPTPARPRTSPRLRSRIATISSICSAVDDQRRAEGDPVGVEPAEQAVLERPPADPDAEGRRVGEPRLGRAVADELDRLEQPLAADVADDGVLPRQRLEAARGAARPARGRWRSRSRSRISRSTAMPGGAGDRVALEGVPLDEARVLGDRAPEGVGDRPPADHRRERRIAAAESPLATQSTSGVTPNVSAANIRPVRPMPGDDLVEDQQDVMPVADLAEDRQVLLGRVDHAAGVADRLDQDGGDGRGVLHLDRRRRRSSRR